MEEDLFDIGIDIPNPADMVKEEQKDVASNEQEQEEISDDVEEVEEDIEEEDLDDDIVSADSSSVNTSNDSDDDEVTPESVFYNFLVENKFIPEDEEFDGSTQKLDEYIKNIGYHAFNNVADSIADDGKNLLKYALALGEDATKDRLQEFFSVRAQIPEVDFDDTNDVKTFLKDYYIATNQYSDEDVDDRIEFLESKGKLSEYAEKHYNDIVEQVDAYEKQQIDQEQQKQQAKQELFNNVRNELMSYDWSIERKKQVADKLSNKEFKRVNSMIQNSPKALIQLADLYTYFDEEKGEFDLSALIDKRANSKTAQKKLDNIEKNSFSSSLSKINNISRTKKGKGGIYVPMPILDEE